MKNISTSQLINIGTVGTMVDTLDSAFFKALFKKKAQVAFIVVILYIATRYVNEK